MLRRQNRRDVHRARAKAVRQLERQRSLTFRPRFQGLEDRVLLSTVVWDSTKHPTGGSWDNASNWMGGAVPTASDDVVIDLTGAGTVTLDTSATDSVNSLTTNANTTISISGDTLSLAASSTIASGLSVTSGGTLDVKSGTLSVTGTVTQSGSVNIDPGGNLTTEAYTQSAGTTTLGGILEAPKGVALDGGMLTGSGVIAGNLTNGADVVPGGVGAAGILAITGFYIQTSGGTLTVNVGGTTAGTEYSQLLADGGAIPNGNLDVDLIGGYVPKNGDEFQVLSYPLIGGEFTNVNLLNFPSGTTLSATYYSTEMLLGAQVGEPVNFTALSGDLKSDLGQIKTSINSAIQAALSIPIIEDLTFLSSETDGLTSLGTLLASALDSIPSTLDNSPSLGTEIQQQVYQALLSPNPKTGNWQLADLNDQNGGTVEMNDVQVQTDVGSHETFSIELLVSATNPANVGFSLGLGNFLKFSASVGSVPLMLTTDYLLSFTFDPTTLALSLNNTVSLASQSAVSPGGALTLPDVPLAIVLEASKLPTSLGSATLAGLLHAAVTDNGSGLSAALGVGLDADENATLALDGQCAGAYRFVPLLRRLDRRWRVRSHDLDGSRLRGDLQLRTQRRE